MAELWLNLPFFYYFFLPPPPTLSGAYLKYLDMYSCTFVVVSNELKTASEEGKKTDPVLANGNLSN